MRCGPIMAFIKIFEIAETPARADKSAPTDVRMNLLNAIGLGYSRRFFGRKDYLVARR
jgi:hypothetical protein